MKLMSMHCGVRFGRSSCMATNRVECIKSCGHKSNHSRKLAAKQQKDTPFQIQEGGIWPGIMHSITTYNLFPLDCRCCPLRLNASMWCHAVRSRFVSFESFANQDVIRSRRGWLSDSSHWISPTCANAQLRFTTPRFARGNSGGWLDAIESTEKPDCLVAALGDSVDSRCTSNYSPWSL